MGGRAAGQERVFALQDTSYLDYTHHSQKGGDGSHIGNEQQKLTGMVMHGSLLMNEAVYPCGLARPGDIDCVQAAKQTSSSERQRLPIEEKESNKWLKSAQFDCRERGL